MILPLHDALRARIRARLTELYGLDAAARPAVAIQYPPNRELGDLAVTVAFDLARVLRKAPRLIAGELAAALGPLDGVARVEATPAGYVNVYLERAAHLRRVLAEAPAASGAAGSGAGDGGKTIVEHTAINPNKAAHIGHLRNAALGDSLVRLLRFQGRAVETQNYIDDTGVQVADIIVGFQQLEGRTLEQIRELAGAPRFDYDCWDLYARVTAWYAEDKGRLDLRARMLRDLEHGDNANAAAARVVADRIVGFHLATMDRLNVEYDLLSWEGDILQLDFWATAFDVLKAAGAVTRSTEGRHAGCWVMPIDPGDGAADDDAEARAKVIVRSDGTVTYVGKDIAYQLWKFGLLGKDFQYRPLGRQRSGRPLWSTRQAPADAAGAVEAPPAPEPAETPRFGAAHAVYNVIDTRQSYLQQLLAQALAAIGHPAQAERSFHFAYEMVALSHATAQALGYDTSAESGRPFVEVSGRRGQGVKADDLLDRVVAAARAEVAARNPELPAADADRTAAIIATAAVRYFMVKYSRTKVIAFDIDEALSFEGESGPYLQYAAVRAGNILGKLEARHGEGETQIAEAAASLPDAALDAAGGTDLWALVLDASRLDEVVEQAVRTLELSALAKYAFGLAQAFNAFYHRYPVLAEPQRAVRLCRAAAVLYVRRQLTRALDLMGCEVPARM